MRQTLRRRRGLDLLRHSPCPGEPTGAASATATATRSRATTSACSQQTSSRPTANSRASSDRAAGTSRAISCGHSSTRTRPHRATGSSSTATARSCCAAMRGATTASWQTPASPRSPNPAAMPSWVRPIDELDLVKTLAKLTVRAGIASFIDPIVGAAAARPAGCRGVGAARDRSEERRRGPAAARAGRSSGMERRTRFGSNAVALGSDLTNDGGGALLGNPALPLARHQSLPRRTPHHSGPLRRDGLGDLRIPAGQHRLQPARGLEPHRLHRAALRGPRADARRRRPDVLRLRRCGGSDDHRHGDGDRSCSPTAPSRR